MMAVCVDPKRINEVWPHFKKLISNAIERVGLNSFEQIERDVISGRSLLWLAYENDRKIVHGAAVTELRNGICELVACGGEKLPIWLPLINDLEQFARNEGCKAMRIYGRQGWVRVLKNYKTKAVILEREL